MAACRPPSRTPSGPPCATPMTPPTTGFPIFPRSPKPASARRRALSGACNEMEASKDPHRSFDCLVLRCCSRSFHKPAAEKALFLDRASYRCPHSQPGRPSDPRDALGEAAARPRPPRSPSHRVTRSGPSPGPTSQPIHIDLHGKKQGGFTPPAAALAAPGAQAGPQAKESRGRGCNAPPFAGRHHPKHSAI